jgi:hypothetical protein
VAPAALVERAVRIRTATAAHRDRRAALDKRFDTSSEVTALARGARTGSRRGLLSREDELNEQIPTLELATEKACPP